MQGSARGLVGRVETVNVEGAPHIRLSGECDMALVVCLHEHVQAHLGAGYHRVIFDLERVTFVDSSVLGVFLDTRRAASAREVVLLCRPGFVRRLLSLLELDQLMKVCTPEEWREQTAALQ